MSDSIINPFNNPANRSKAGKSRAAKLSPERRREIAILASHSRKSFKDVPTATHFGKLKIGPTEVTCAVLEDGRSVITETSVYKLLGMKPGGRKKKGDAQIPRFLSPECLQKYIPDHLGGCPESFSISMPRNGGKAYAYEAEKLTSILKLYYQAGKDGVLTKSLVPVAITAEIILMALADVGLVGLIHECTGFQKDREKNALQDLFSKFIAEELQPWVKRFPDSFFQHLKRMYNMEDMKKNPMFFGHLINRWIYKELSPEIHDELRRLNPIIGEGRRKVPHHRLLSQDVGCPALERQITKVITLMSVSDDRDQFEKLLEKSKH